MTVIANDMNEAKIGTARSLACVQLTFFISWLAYIQSIEDKGVPFILQIGHDAIHREYPKLTPPNPPQHCMSRTFPVTSESILTRSRCT